MRPVALVASRYLPHVGGVEEHVRNVARQMRADGVPVVVWAADSGAADQPSEVDGITVRYLPCPLPWWGPRSVALFPLRAPVAALRWWQAWRADRPRVLHVQCFGTNGVWAAALARLTRTPLVVSTHGETFGDADGVFDRSAGLRRSLRRALARAAAVTGCSGIALRDLRERFGLAADAGTVVPNGVDLDEPVGERPAWLPERYVIAVGRVVSTKGFDLLIDAYARARPDADLVVWGDGAELEALRDQAAERGVADRVHLPGRLDRGALVAAIRGSLALAVPSRTEAFGIVVLEGWRAGVPVVATSRGGPGELVRDGVTGLVADPEDVAALGEALTRVTADAGLRERMGAAGRAEVASYTWAAVTRAYRDVYRAAGIGGPEGSDGPDGDRAEASARLASARSGTGLRAWARRRFGLWALFEWRNRLVGWPRALAGRVFEAREVRRLAGRTAVPAARVTTVISTFRRPEDLVRAVRSALDQTVTDHTVVVVDDGGGLPELPDDPRLVALSLARNTGRPGMVRNVGLALARSPYVAFLDDDNTWLPEHLEVALAALEDGADLVYTGVERVHPDGTVVDVLSTPFDRRALTDRAFVDTNSLVLRHGPDVRFSRLHRTRDTLPGEDWELVWRLSRRRRTRHVPVTTVRYVVNPDSYFTHWRTAEA